jgi:hypothetical protein
VGARAAQAAAALHPWRRAVGVEIAPALHAVALQNAERWRAGEASSEDTSGGGGGGGVDISFICADAIGAGVEEVTSVYESASVLLCLCTAFSAPMMEALARRLEVWTALRARPARLPSTHPIVRLTIGGCGCGHAAASGGARGGVSDHLDGGAAVGGVDGGGGDLRAHATCGYFMTRTESVAEIPLHFYAFHARFLS